MIRSHSSAHRGANSPLLHCGTLTWQAANAQEYHRGANSPLLHCGCPKPTILHACKSTPRGEFAPPTLRPMLLLAWVSWLCLTEGRIRPSYIAAARGGSERYRPALHRGANSPLLHCGTFDDPFLGRLDYHRGANSPLLHCGTSSGLFPSSFCLHRGANSPLLHCGRASIVNFTNESAPRGEFAPPTLRR